MKLAAFRRADSLFVFIQGLAGWLGARELWLLGLAAPLLLFPLGLLPWLGLSLVVLGWAARLLAGQPLLTASALQLPAWLLAVLALLASTISLEPELSWPKMWGMVLGAALCSGVARSAGSPGQALRLGQLLLAGAVLVAALSLAGTDWTSVRLVSLPELYGRLPTLLRGLPDSGLTPHSDLFHSREVGATMGLLLPPALALALFASQPRLRLAAALAALACTGVLLLSQSLQALCGVLLALWALLLWRSRRWLLLAPLAVAALGLALWAFGLERAVKLALSVDNPFGLAVALRLDIWSRAWAMVRDLPYTGIGLNTFPVVQSEFYTGYLIGPEPHAHNFYLQTAVDLGLPGLLVMAWALASFGAGLWRNYRAVAQPDYRALLVGVGAGVLSFAVHGLVDTVTLGAKPAAALWVMLALAAAPSSGCAVAAQRWIPGRLAWPLMSVVLLVPGLALLRPVGLPLNLALLRAHRALYAVEPQAADLQAAAQALQPALAGTSASAPGYYTLGRLQARLGQHPAALESLRAGLKLDLAEGPTCHYYPSHCWLRSFGLEPASTPWQDASQVYTQWLRRFPRRAEGYVLAALAAQYGGDRVSAAQVLHHGLEHQAEPRGLLQFALSELATGQTKRAEPNSQTQPSHYPVRWETSAQNFSQFRAHYNDEGD